MEKNIGGFDTDFEHDSNPGVEGLGGIAEKQKAEAEKEAKIEELKEEEKQLEGEPAEVQHD